MTINTPPTAADIRIESRLYPQQVSPGYNVAAVEADIDTLITTYQPVIERKLSDVADSAANQTIAQRALTLRVLSALFDSSGQLNEAYERKAIRFAEESQELIDSLHTTGAETIDEVVGARSGTMTMTRRDGYGSGDAEVEYCSPTRRRCGCW